MKGKVTVTKTVTLTMDMEELGDIVRFLSKLQQEENKFPNGPELDLVEINKKMSFLYRNASNASITNEDLDFELEF